MLFLPKYWTLDDLRSVRAATTFEELSAVGLKILNVVDFDGMVCGPMTSGGYGNLQANYHEFKKAHRRLNRWGLVIFNQLPFEPHLGRVLATPYCQGPDHLLEVFYGKLFSTGRLPRFYFLPQWETSYGTNWEHNQAIALGIERIYL